MRAACSSHPTSRSSRNAGLYGPAEARKTAYGQESQPDAAFLDDWLARTAEIVDKYQPQLVWFDWWIEQPDFQPYLQKFAAYYYNRGVEWKRGVAINYKLKSFPEKAAVLDVERGQTGRHPAALLADRHLDQQALLGLHPERRVTRRRTRSWTTWPTSSARTARCC